MATADHDLPEDKASLLNLNNDILNEILGYLSLQVCMYVVIFEIRVFSSLSIYTLLPTECPKIYSIYVLHLLKIKCIFVVGT